MRRRHGSSAFTLVELLVVIVIIAIIAALILPGIQGARKRANWAKCSSNLHQLSLAWLDYLHQNNDRTPDWLSTLHPEYCASKDVYVCPADLREGRTGSKPQELLDWNPDEDPFNNTDDTFGSNGVVACSYLYEMCAGICEISPSETWKNYKLREMREGLPAGYDLTRFPVIRCYHHWRERMYEGVDLEGNPFSKDGMTINVAYAGNIFYSAEHWKYTSCREK